VFSILIGQKILCTSIASYVNVQTCVSDCAHHLESIAHQFHFSFESLAKLIT